MNNEIPPGDADALERAFARYLESGDLGTFEAWAATQSPAVQELAGRMLRTSATLVALDVPSWESVRRRIEEADAGDDIAAVAGRIEPAVSTAMAAGGHVKGGRSIAPVESRPALVERVVTPAGATVFDELAVVVVRDDELVEVNVEGVVGPYTVEAVLRPPADWSMTPPMRDEFAGTAATLRVTPATGGDLAGWNLVVRVAAGDATCVIRSILS